MVRTSCQQQQRQRQQGIHHLSAAEQGHLEEGLGAGRRSRCQQGRKRLTNQLYLLYPTAGPHEVDLRYVLAVGERLAPVLQEMKNECEEGQKT